MDFLFDEGAGAKKIKTLLREKGHNVKAMNESGLSGTKDPHVLEILLEENRFIVTCDTDFLQYRNDVPFGAILIKGDYKVTSELAERLVWTIESITQNPDILNDLTVLERDTPYGSWKMYTQGDKTVITGLNYFIDRLTISSQVEFTSIPVSNLDSEDRCDT
jgi:predicted nuclease of predicted toxin-antitoxin system